MASDRKRSRFSDGPGEPSCDDESSSAPDPKISPAERARQIAARLNGANGDKSPSHRDSKTASNPTSSTPSSSQLDAENSSEPHAHPKSPSAANPSSSASNSTSTGSATDLVSSSEISRSTVPTNSSSTSNPSSSTAVELRKKIYIPINKFKDMDFARLIYGAQDATKKRVEADSGCTICLKGRGANRDDPSLDDPEDLHVLVVGFQEEQVKRAEDLVRNILADPALVDESKVQKTEWALTVRNAQHGYNDPNLATRSIIVKRELVGAIIGKAGEKIREIKDSTGAHVMIVDPPDASEPMRTVNLRGSQESVDRAAMIIDSLIAQRDELPPRMRPHGTERGPPRNMGRERFEVVIPNEFAGKIIGRRGMTIKGIQDRTLTKIEVPREADSRDPRNRTVVVYADSQRDYEAAKAEIEAVIADSNDGDGGFRGSHGGQGGHGPPSNGHREEMLVSDDHAGLIIGKRGSTISGIEGRTGAKVQIIQPPEGTSPGQRQVVFKGSPAQCAAARREVDYVLNSVNNNNNNMYGNYGYGNYGHQYAAWQQHGQQYPHSGYGHHQQTYQNPSQHYGRNQAYQQQRQHSGAYSQDAGNADGKQGSSPATQATSTTPTAQGATTPAAVAATNSTTASTQQSSTQQQQQQAMGANGQKYTREQWKEWKKYYAQYGYHLDDEPPAHLLADS